MKSIAGMRREIVEAGAGCGKTTGLVDRYLEGLGYLAINPSEKKLKATGLGFRVSDIFCLTFTIEASEQMKERILERCKSAGLDTLFDDVFHRSQISTIHSLCYRLLRPYLGSLGYSEELSDELAAQYQRKSFAIQMLGNFEQAESLLRVLPLEELLQITCKLWNSSTLDSDSKAITAKIKKTTERFKELCLSLLKESQVMAGRYNELMAKSKAKNIWLLDLIDGLQKNDRKLLASLSFRALKEIKDAEPEFFARVEDIKDFAKGLFWTSTSIEALEEESQLESSLKQFILSCRIQGPRILDFSALEFELLNLLRLKAKTTERLCPPPKLLLVDEFQDTSPLQMEILDHLSSDETQWYFVGDPKQSIYAFRGSDVGLFIQARQELKLLTLANNYRSHPKILDFVNVMQEQLFDPQDKLDPPAQKLLVPPTREELIQDSLTEARVALHVFASRAEHCELWQQLIKNIHQKKQHLKADATHAVLFRRWSGLREFAEHLSSLGMTYEILGSETYLNHLLTDLFADFLTSLDDPKNPRAGIGFSRWNLGMKSIENPLALASSLRDPIEALALFSNTLECRRFPRGAHWLSAMNGFLKNLLQRENRYTLDLADLIWILRKQAKTAEVSIATSIEQQSTVQARPIQLMTLHGSKGLQFDAVYLPELFEKRGSQQSKIAEHEDSLGFNFTLQNSTSGERRGSLLFLARIAESERLKIAEQKRLFYVATTRSKEFLSLYLRSAPENRDEAPINSTLRSLGWPALEPVYWNDFLIELNAKGSFNSQRSSGALQFSLHENIDEAEDDEGSLDPKEAPILEATRAPDNWTQIQASSDFTNSPIKASLRMGVSRFLNLESEDSQSSKEEAVAKPQANNWLKRSSEIGDEFHAVLELWDGQSENVEALLKFTENQSVFRQALNELRKLDSLKEYWPDLKQGRVLRELGLFIIDESKRLSGFSDAVWFPKGSQPVVIDWKTTSSMSTLKKPERLEKIRAQLKLYQESLAKSGRYQPKRLAVGIELSKTPKVEALFFE